MRVITPASRAVVLRALARAENRLRVARRYLASDGGPDIDAARTAVDDTLNDLREIEVEIAGE